MSGRVVGQFNSSSDWSQAVTVKKDIFTLVLFSIISLRDKMQQNKNHNKMGFHIAILGQYSQLVKINR